MKTKKINKNIHKPVSRSTRTSHDFVRITLNEFSVTVANPSAIVVGNGLFVILLINLYKNYNKIFLRKYFRCIQTL